MEHILLKKILMETETRAAMVDEFILRRWGNQMQYSELTRIPVMHSWPLCGYVSDYRLWPICIWHTCTLSAFGYVFFPSQIPRQIEMTY